MKWLPELPANAFEGPARVTVLEAPSGPARSEVMQGWLAEGARRGGSSYFLPCHIEDNGPWSGLIELFGELVPQLESRAPELLERHNLELCVVLPTLQRRMAVANPTLTDVSPNSERTRNYPLDRAYRIVQGLVDLFVSARERVGRGPCLIACDELDHGGALVRSFFTELIRRRGDRADVRLLISAEPGHGDALAQAFPAGSLQPGARMALPPDPNPPPTAEEWLKRAELLTAQAELDFYEKQLLLPQLIRAWTRSPTPARAIPYQVEALSIYNTRGFYEDGLVFGEAALAAIQKYGEVEKNELQDTCVKLYSSYVGLRKIDDAMRMCELAISRSDVPETIAQWRYMRSMLHARFLADRDLVFAEQDLEQGFKDLNASQLPQHKKVFLLAFNRNGLALIRHMQGRAEEAIALCRWGYQQLDLYLDPEQQRLHRSVLIYNIAQVLSTMGRTEEAISHLTEAMGSDPNYSEYYNERGNLLMKLGRPVDALVDYREAVRLSPPYFEVWTNMGQCFQALDRTAEARDAYDHAIDIAPRSLLALLGRAQARDALGDSAGALRDYDQALEIDPKQPEALMNRAVLHFDAGRLDPALADLDRAVALAPHMADLYQNRAVALKALGRERDAEQDLGTYARLSSEPPTPRNRPVATA